MVDHDNKPIAIVNEAAVMATPPQRRPWVDAGSMARSIEPGVILSADLQGMALLDAIRRSPASEYLLVEPSGEVAGVLAARDLDQVFAGVLVPSNLSRVKARTQRGPFSAGDQVQLTDPKGRMHQIVLQAGGTFHTHRGSLSHDDLIGSPEGSVVTASSGTAYVALRPLLADYTLAMKRGATIVYPKDAAQILAYADVFPGARVLEAGAGSGALSCWLLRAIGPDGELVSFEARPDFAEIARENVRKYFGEVPAWWRLVTGELSARVALDPSLPTGAAYSRLHPDEPEPGEPEDAGRPPGRQRHLRPGDPGHARPVGERRTCRARPHSRRPDLLLRRDHDAAVARGRGTAGARRLLRARRLGDPVPRLARRRPRGAARPPDDRAHRVPRHRAPAGERRDRAGPAPQAGEGRPPGDGTAVPEDGTQAAPQRRRRTS